MSRKPSSELIKAALRLHYTAPLYVTLEEVRNATGRLKKRAGKTPRYADMLAMALWPSLGLEILGFEIKTSRADWLREISDEKKAVAVSQFCDRWYLVTHDASIVREGELPAGWGILEVTGSQVKEVVKAPKLDATPVTREFLASLLRNASSNNPSQVSVAAQVEMASSAAKPPVRLVRRRKSALKAATSRVARRSAADTSLHQLMMQG